MTMIPKFDFFHIFVHHIYCLWQKVMFITEVLENINKEREGNEDKCLVTVAVNSIKVIFCNEYMKMHT